MNFRSLALGCLMGAASFGCVNSSPRIESGVYSDSRRDVCFSTPDSWEKVNEFPSSFELTPNHRGGSVEISRSRDLIFMSSQGDGVMVVQFDHSDVNARALPPDQLGELILKAQTSRKDLLSKAYQISDYRFSTTPSRVADTPVCMASERFNYGDGKTFSSDLFVFSNDLGNTCCVRVMLFSERANLGENRLAFEHLRGTIKRLNPHDLGRPELVLK